MICEWTPIPELNAVLARFLAEVRAILGDTMIGAYVQGSFALDAGDEQSDCDFLVVVRDDLSAQQIGELALLHDATPLRPGHWTKHLEGSYPIARELRSDRSAGAEWWFVDHGWRAIQRSTHCNHNFVRWILRERGITLAGPPPTRLVDPIPAEAMRAEMRAELPGLVPGTLAWTTLDIAWAQRYLVATACRMLYTLSTGQVASKRAALEWAIGRCDPEWTPLLRQVAADRPRGFVAGEPPRPGSVDRSLAFVDYVQHLSADW